MSEFWLIKPFRSGFDSKFLKDTLAWLGLFFVTQPVFAQSSQSRPDVQMIPSIINVYRSIDLGSGDPTPKDYTLSLGLKSGARIGDRVLVYRRSNAFNAQSRQLVREQVIPVGRLKVIYSDDSTSVAREEALLPTDLTPNLNPRAFMVGDLVQLEATR